MIDEIISHDLVLINGALGTRLQYTYKFNLGKNLSIFDLIQSCQGKNALAEIYKMDIEAAHEYSLPIIIYAPTFRASRAHLNLHNQQKDYINYVNQLCTGFIKSIKDEYTNNLSSPVYFSAALGSRNDAYDVDYNLTVEQAKDYHQEQINILKKSEISLIHVATLSSVTEALGIAYAAQEAHVEYTIGFILDENGLLLDGNNLSDAIRKLDDQVEYKPAGYFITCTHASVVLKVISEHGDFDRIIGVQVNG